MNDLKTTLDLHKDHKLWDSELSLNLAEIKTFEKKLSQVQSQLKNPEKIKSLESFQNQFIVNSDAINKLKNDIQRHEIVVAKKAKDETRNINNADKDFHKTTFDKLEVQKAIFRDLRNSFYHFVSDLKD